LTEFNSPYVSSCSKTVPKDNRNNAIVHIVQICGCSTQYIYCMQNRVSSIHFFALTVTSKAQPL